jgi:hypothetical protein
MAARKALRVVAEGEKADAPLTLLEAVALGDPLAIKKAQLRLMAESVMAAGENTRPQYDQRISRLTDEIAELEARRAVEIADASVVAPLEPTVWDGTGF